MHEACILNSYTWTWEQYYILYSSGLVFQDLHVAPWKKLLEVGLHGRYYTMMHMYWTMSCHWYQFYALGWRCDLCKPTSYFLEHYPSNHRRAGQYCADRYELCLFRVDVHTADSVHHCYAITLQQFPCMSPKNDHKAPILLIAKSYYYDTV